MTDFATRDWHDEPAVDTPIDAAGLKDLELRLAGYVDTRIPQAALAGAVALADPATGDVTWGLATDANIAGANLNGAANKPSLRTTDRTAGAAMAYNDPRVATLSINVKDTVYAGGAAGTGAAGAHDDAPALAAAYAAAAAIVAGGVACDVHHPSGDYWCNSSQTSGGGGEVAGAVYSMRSGWARWLTLRGAGAKITLTSNCPRFWDFYGSDPAPGTVFSFLRMHDLTVDANNVTGNHHVVLGTRRGGFDQYYAGCDHLEFLRVRVVNAPSSLDYAQAVALRHGFRLICLHHHWMEATAGQVTNVYFESCEVWGCDVGYAAGGGGGQLAETGTAQQITGLAGAATAAAGSEAGDWYYRAVGLDASGYTSLPSAEVRVTATAAASPRLSGWSQPANIVTMRLYRGNRQGWYTQYQDVAIGAGTFDDVGAGWADGTLRYGANVWCDQIRAVNCKHHLDPTGADRVNTTHGSGAGFQFGIAGYGGRFEWRDCDVWGAVDVSYEADNHSSCLFDNCTGADNVVDAAFYLGSYAWGTTPQSTTYRDCKAPIAYAAAVTATGYTGWKINPVGGGVPAHHVKLADCDMKDRTPGFALSGGFGWGGAVQTFGEWGHLDIHNLTVEKNNVHFTGATSLGTTVVLSLNSNGNATTLTNRVTMTGINTIGVAGRNDLTGGASYNLVPVNVQAGTFVLDLAGLRTTENIAGAPLHSFIVFRFGFGVNTTVAEGVVRGHRPQVRGDQGGWLFQLGGSHLAVTSRLLFADCDLSGIAGTSSSFANLNVVNGGFEGKVFAHNLVPQGTYPVAPAALVGPVSSTGVDTSGSGNTLTGITNGGPWYQGQSISAPGVAAGTTISGVSSTTGSNTPSTANPLTLTLSVNLTGAGAAGSTVAAAVGTWVSRNVEGVPYFASGAGGTVTNVEPSRTGVWGGEQRSVATATNFAVLQSPGDYLRITYSGSGLSCTKVYFK